MRDSQYNIVKKHYTKLYYQYTHACDNAKSVMFSRCNIKDQSQSLKQVEYFSYLKFPGNLNQKWYQTLDEDRDESTITYFSTFMKHPLYIIFI